MGGTWARVQGLIAHWRHGVLLGRIAKAERRATPEVTSAIKYGMLIVGVNSTWYTVIWHCMADSLLAIFALVQSSRTPHVMAHLVLQCRASD